MQQKNHLPILILFTSFVLLCGCSNPKQSLEAFQLAQVHNQASKKLNNKGLPTHYVMLQASPDQAKLTASDQIKITNVLQSIADKSQYEVIVVGNADNGQQMTANKIVNTDSIIMRLKQIEKILLANNMHGTAAFDTQLPKNYIYIEFKPGMKETKLNA